MSELGFDSDWITTAQAAEEFGYHPERIRELVREKRIKGAKFGGVWVVSRTSLIEYKKRLSGKPKPGPKPKISKP